MGQKKSGTPKKRRPATIALHLPREAVALLARCLGIWEAIKADKNRFPNPYPTATEIEGVLDAFKAAVIAAEGGDPVKVAALRGVADKARQLFGLLGKWVQALVRSGPADDAAETIAAALMFESKVGQRAPKPELAATKGAASGQARVSARAVKSAVSYFWEHSPDQQTWISGDPTAQCQTVVDGLTPGKTYYFRFRALLRDGTMTDPSQIVSFMAQ